MTDPEAASKAIEEVAKLGQDIVSNVDSLERVGKAILGPFGEAYGMLTDMVRYKREEIRWRLQNRLKIFQRASLKLEEMDIKLENLKAIPPRIAYDYESHLEQEDNESLQNLWANLLVNVTLPNGTISPRKSFRKVLESLDPDDVAIFNEFGLRKDEVRAYFMVAGTNTGGCEICPLKYGFVEDRELISTPLFEYLGGSFYSPWGEEKIQSIVDHLQSLGLMHRTADDMFSIDQLESDFHIAPPEGNLDLGRTILQNARGLDAFGISQLGIDFFGAVSDPARRAAEKD